MTVVEDGVRCHRRTVRVRPPPAVEAIFANRLALDREADAFRYRAAAIVVFGVASSPPTPINPRSCAHRVAAVRFGTPSFR